MSQLSWPAAFRMPLILLALGAAPLTDLPAQDTTCSRCLNSHRFLPSTLLGNPFASSHFVNATGGGMAMDLEVPVRDLDGNVVGTAGGDIGFMLLDFEYQKSIIPRLALRANLRGTARVGTSTTAIVASGASAIFGWSVGGTVPIWGNQTFLVSGVGDYRNSNEFVVDPYGFAQRIRQGGLDDSSLTALLHSEDSNRWSAGVRAAWAPQDWLGVNLVVESGRIDSPTLGDNSLTEFGLQTGVDFLNINRWPIGVSLAYREQVGPAKQGDVTGSYRSYEGGLFYTGARNFTIGGNFFWSRIAVRDGSVPDIDAIQFRLVTRLDF